MGRLIGSYAERLIERVEFEPRVAGFRQCIAGWDGQIKAMRDEAALQSTLSLVIGRPDDFAKQVHDRMSDRGGPLRLDSVTLSMIGASAGC